MIPVQIVSDGGSMVAVILAAAAVAAPVPVVLAFLVARGRRVPVAPWLLGPLVVLALGYVGAARGAGEALEVIPAASLEMRSVLASSGWASAAAPELLALWLGGALLLWSGLLAAVATARRSDAPRSWSGAVVQVLCVGLGIVLAVGWPAWAAGRPTAVFEIGLGPVALVLGGLVLGGVCLADVARLQPEGDDEAAAVARARVLVALVVVIGVYALGRGFAAAGMARAHHAMAHASPEMLETLAFAGLEVSEVMARVTLGAALGALLGGCAAVLPLARRLWGVRGAVDLVLLLPLAALVAGLAIWREGQMEQLEEWTVLSPRLVQLEATSGKSLPERILDRNYRSSCVVWQGEGGWTGRSRHPTGGFDGCGASVGLPLSGDVVPLVFVDGDAPLTALADPGWFAASGRLEVAGRRPLYGGLLERVGRPLAHGMTPLVWHAAWPEALIDAAHPAEPADTIVIDATGDTLRVGHHAEVLQDPDTLEDLIPRRAYDDPPGTAIVIAGGEVPVDEVLDLCVDATRLVGARATGCHLVPGAPPAPEHEAGDDEGRR